MDFIQLKYFLQFCVERNFKRAAENLYITPQGLHKAIKKLEDDLGCSLYVKDNNEIVLTEAGAELFQQTKILSRNIDTLNRKMASFSEREKNHVVRVVCAYAVYGKLYPNIFGGLEQAFPKITFQFSEHPDLLCEKSVMENDADIGFTIGPFEPELNFYVVPLKSYHVFAMVNESNPIAKASALGCKDLQNEEILIANEKFKIYHTFTKQCFFDHVKPNIIFKASEISSIYSLCKSNKGVGITLDFLGDHSECRLIPIEPEIRWSISLVVKKENSSKQPFRDIIHYVKRSYDSSQI